MRRGKEKLLAGLLTVGMVVSSMFSSLTPVYAAEITETTETQVYEETDESVTQSVDETEAQSAEETESVESTEVSKEESDIESSESINHTPGTESTESVESTEGGESGTNAKPNVSVEKGEATAVVTVKIDGTQYDATSIEDAVTQSGVTASNVESIEFVSGTITAADLTYMKETTKYLTDLKMNLSENLKLTDAEGAESTAVPGSAFKSTRLETVELGGFTEIKADAFNGCTKLTSVKIPNMEVIGVDAFYRTDDYETIVLPASLKKLDGPNFGVARNGRKTLKVTMEGMTPPEASGRIFEDAKGGTITVPEGALPNYLTKLDFSKYFMASGDTEWNGLPVVDPAYHYIHYKGVNSWDNRYAYVKNGEKVTADRIPTFKNGEMELVGWNTVEEGTGKALDADTVMSAEWDVDFIVYAQWAEPAPVIVTVKINGTQYEAASLEDAVTQSGVTTGNVESIEFVSGTITAADLTYMKETTKYLTDLKMNLSENLKLTDAEGAESKAVPGDAFKNTRLETVELGGFTEIKAGAFNGCTKLTSVKMPNMEVIGVDAFYRTDDYETIVLPASLKKLDGPNFGVARNGRKTLKVTMEGMTPPEASGRIFEDAKGGTITVPEGALPNYLTKLDFSKYFMASGDTEWNGLPVVDPAYHYIHYKGANSWDNRYAYVKNGEKVTADRIPTFKNGEMELVGWNTVEEGTGKALDADTVMSAEWDVDFIVYAQWEEPAPVIVIVKINGTQYDAVSLEDAVTQSGVTASNVESIEFVSGTITAADLTYMKETTKYLADLKMNLSENLKLTDAEGAESKAVPGDAFKNTRLETVELGGFTEIKAGAFNGCTKLTSVKMPNMEVIGVDAFYRTDDYETIVLPASLKKLDGPNFGVARNGSKTLKVTMEGMTPPEASGRIFGDAKGGTITVPEGALPNYLTKLDFSKYFMASGDTEWEGLPVVDPAYHYIHYKGVNSWDNRYAYVKNGEKVTADRIPTFKNGDMELVGWNTEKDNSGKALDADTVMSDEWAVDFIVYAQWAEPAPDVVVVKINGTEYSAKSVEDAVTKSGVTADNVESIEFVSGIITAADLKYMKQTTKYLTNLKMNLSENLKLTDAEGAETTELPASAFMGTRLESVEIGGFTVIGARAFESCTSLASVAMPNVVEIEKDAFYHTDDYETIVLPASLKTMNNPGFGQAKNGTKTLDVTMEGSVPPTISGRVFGDAKGGTVTVPAGALPNYLTGLDFTKWFSTSGSSEWGGLPVIDPAYHLVHYKGVNSWDNKYAYVKDGEKVTADRIPTFKNDDKVLVGWNTEKDNSGKALNAETEMNAEWAVSFTVYAQWAEQVTVTFDVDGTTTEVKVIKGEAIGDKLPKEPSKEGWTFKGWNTKADGTGEAVTAETKADADMTVYAVFEEVIVPPVMDSVTAENGKVTIVLKDKPTKAPTLEDIQLQMNLNGTGDKDIKITGFTYDDDKTIVLTFDKVAQTDKAQKFTLTVTLDGKSVTTDEINVDAKDLIRDFVVRLYTQLLGRKPDEAGLESWTEVLRSQKEQGAKVAQGFVESPEFKKRNLSDKEYISILYRTFLDREADAAGLAAWQKLLDDGLSRLYVFKGFAESDEFTEICNSYGIIRGNVILTAPMDQNENVTKFIARCYKFCLGRKGDEAGINGWCNQILTGKNTAKQAAYGFVFSDEFKKKNLSDEEFVKTMYRVFMNREADAAGLKGWVEVLKNGKSREHVFNGFADSNEFKEICESYGIK